MALERLEVENVRCIEAASLELDSQRNLVFGPNGSGKTSLLESIYFLGRARSFRPVRNDALIRGGTQRLVTAGHVAKGARTSVLGVAFDSSGLEARFDGRPVTGAAELATIFPVQAIDPALHQLVEEGPQHRRRYLDWGVFHVERPFVAAWQRFQRALRQRNAALRCHASDALVRAWDIELIEAGNHVADARRRYVDLLNPQVNTMGLRLLEESIRLRLAPGWAQERSLAEALQRSWARDRERGVTHVGPQRADIQVQVGGEAARGRVSRGQQKMVAAAMLLGQLRCNLDRGAGPVALLVDDPAAELDPESLDRLLTAILELPVQLFVTALDPSIPALQLLGKPATFHVKHGVLTRLI